MGHNKMSNKDYVEEINIFRVNLGLKPIIVKNTNCIICHKKFESLDYPRERMCEFCRRETDNFMSFYGDQDLI